MERTAILLNLFAGGESGNTAEFVCRGRVAILLNLFAGGESGNTAEFVCWGREQQYC